LHIIIIIITIIMWIFSVTNNNKKLSSEKTSALVHRAVKIRGLDLGLLRSWLARVRAIQQLFNRRRI